MMKKITALLACTLGGLFINANAQTLGTLNSALSVMNINHALAKNIAAIPYAGKDITVSESGGLRAASLLNGEGIIC